ncbi:NAD(P)H-dependent oxidoreductase [Nonomuraea sp. NPDC049784]|uniref:NADPH-dependent FMN reductase n=1 Tax=Nonomuraea sp. NPDC049784 TaxID=3154361 RepID=UPI0034034E35
MAAAARAPAGQPTWWHPGSSRARAGFEVELADLRDWPPSTPRRSATPATRPTPNRSCAPGTTKADAFIVVTPEYNRSIPAGLKNAIDSVWLSFGFRNSRSANPRPEVTEDSHELRHPCRNPRHPPAVRVGVPLAEQTDGQADPP